MAMKCDTTIDNTHLLATQSVIKKHTTDIAEPLHTALEYYDWLLIFTINIYGET